MGKKSRLKRERKLQEEGSKPAVRKPHVTEVTDSVFERITRGLRTILGRYRADEAIVAATISELWMPNIAAGVKYQLLLRIALSMAPSEYTHSESLASYETFRTFLNEIHDALPDFPTMEDFVPELDWGEVRFSVRDRFVPILYGCGVERIPDYVTAFRLVHAADPSANRDMDAALLMQADLIARIQSQPDPQLIEIRPGHVEIPPPGFWEECGAALRSTGVSMSVAERAPSPDLIVDIGVLAMPKSRLEFGERFMDGTSVPGLCARVGDYLIPLSPRNAPAVVIERWFNRSGSLSERQLGSLAVELGNFLADRFPQHKVFTGPLTLRDAKKSLPNVLAGAFVTHQKLFVVIPANVEDDAHIARMCRRIRAFMTSSGEWGFQRLGEKHGMQLRRPDGLPFPADDVVILVVSAHVTAQASLVPDLGATARVIGLSDFVGVFDSLRDIAEFGRFLLYVADHKDVVMGLFAGFTDLFGSFRDTHGLLVDGAVEPTMISLDPHWGSNWRFKELSEFWKSAPPNFPDGKPTWAIESKDGSGLFRMITKGEPALSWSTMIGECCVHVVFPFIPDETDATNGNLLETFVHCAADALSQRRPLIEGLRTFQRTQIAFVCRPDPSSLVPENPDEVTANAADQVLISHQHRVATASPDRLMLRIDVNMARIQSAFRNASDASFEADCAIELLRCLALESGETIDSALVAEIRKTSAGRPRFVMQALRREIDVPDHATPILPEPSDYKRARRDLAVVFREIGVEPGRYELAEAKAIINRGRDAYRTLLRTQIADFDLVGLVSFCVEQHDAAIAHYQRRTKRVEISLAHEVSYSRTEVTANAFEEFSRNARNYRYLIEAALRLRAQGSALPSKQQTVELVARVDWLLVLYGASDVLHNGIEPGGMILDEHFVPEVFYSDDFAENERAFSLEQARLKLGTELATQDEVHGLRPGPGLDRINKAFEIDLGFTLSHLVACLATLSQWPTANDSKALALSYRATTDELVAGFCANVDGLEEERARQIIPFITLDSTQIDHLLHKEEPESDVPVWEHYKRHHRLTIRPLIALRDNAFLWGAGCAGRAARIWVGSIGDGYLPADFDWPSVKAEVRSIKKGIETALEHRAFEICARATPYVSENIDFMHRFKTEKFDDVGDFDVLAYWPESNQWIAVECKYNQPPFCLKDARRLRDTIYGTGTDHGQFAKIERRHRFLHDHSDRLRMLLSWPSAPAGVPLSVLNVYVSREIYWSMRNPRYRVDDTHFVRIDALDRWLRDARLLIDAPRG